MLQAARTLGHTAREIVQNGGFLLDVRTPDEHRQATIPNSINIPVQELEARLREIDGRKNQPVVVYCRSGGRSAMAATILMRAGFNQVHDLGAMSNW